MNPSSLAEAERHGVVLLMIPAVAGLDDDSDVAARAYAAVAASRYARALEVLAAATDRSGGRVIARGMGFAVAAWPFDAPTEGVCADGTRAAHAALDALAEIREGLDGWRDAPASLRFAVGSGSLRTSRVGERRLASIRLVTGSAIHDAGQALMRDPESPAAVSPQASVDAASWRGVDPETAPTIASATGQAEARDRSWSERIQRATVVAVRLDVRLDRESEAADLVARAAGAMQREVARAGGRILAIVPYGPAPVLLAAFGLEGAAVDHHGSRALDSALAIRRASPREGIGVHIGISSGPVLWRGAGHDDDADLLFGRPVSRALTLASSDTGAILCDQATHDESIDRFRWLDVDDEIAFGRRQRSRAFQVVGSIELAAESSAASTMRMVGRDRELGRLMRWLDGAGQGGCVSVVVGDPGMGKTVLLDRIETGARELGRSVLRAAGDPIALESPFGAWRGFVCLEIAPELEAESDPQGAIRAAMAGLGQEAELAPLLAAVADIAMPETKRSASLSQAARGAAIEQILVALVRRTARRGRPVLVLDDAHWMDESSLAVVLRLVDAGVAADVIVASRPVARSGAWPKILAAAGDCTLTLGELDRESSADLVCVAAGGVTASDAAVEWLRSIAGGNPFFLHALLQDALRRGRLRMVTGRLEPAAVQVPDDSVVSLETIVERRIAALDDDARTTLCCASVLGAAPDREELNSLLAANLRGQAGSDAVDRLLSEGLLDATAAGPGLRFHHELIRRAAYAMLPQALRRDLHRQVAERIADGSDELSSRRDALLGHHWEAAGRADLAARHYASAARRAVCDGGSAEAVALYALAMRADDSAAAARALPLERAEWDVFLSGAYWGVGDMAHAEESARRALAGAGDRFPTGNSGYMRRMLVDAARVARWWGDRHVAPQGEERERLSIRMLAARRLADSQYFTGDSSALLCACLAATADALRCRDLAPASRAAGLVAYTAGLVGMTRFSDRLFSRTSQAAHLSGDIGSITGTIGAETMLRVGQADWARAMPLAESTVTLCRTGFDTHDIGSALTLVGLANYFQGHFDPAAAAFVELREMAVTRGRDQHRAWADFALAQTMLPRGDAAGALALLAEAVELLEDLADNVSLMICHSVQAAAHLRLGDLDRAAGAAGRAARLAIATPPRNFGSLEGYAGPVEAFLALAHASDPLSKERGNWLQEASRAMPSLNRYAGLFRLGRPRMHLARGWLAWLSGRTARAAKSWQRASEEARALSMGYDEARVARTLEMTVAGEAAVDAAISGDGTTELRPHPLVI